MRVLTLLIYTAPASLPNPSHPMKQTKRTAEGSVRRTGPERGASPFLTLSLQTAVDIARINKPNKKNNTRRSTKK